MNRTRVLLFLFTLSAFLLSPLNRADAVRLKDVASVKGVRTNQLVGYGLVVGLDGTGDGNKSPFTSQALVNMLENMGVHIDKNDVKVKNVAGVMVTATLPPFSKPGQSIDVTLSALGDANSLQGGTLVATPLKALDGKVYAVAQGPVSIGGFEAETGAGRSQQYHVTVARIPNGASVERETGTTFLGKEEIVLHLNSPDFTTMSRAVNAINDQLAGKYAKAKDSATVNILVPEEFADNEVMLMATLENIEITPDVAARVIIDERTGTVVMGQDVQLKPLAVAHGNLNVEVETYERNTSPLDKFNVIAKDQGNQLVPVNPGATLGELVTALNVIGVTPRDLIAILQSIKAAGALDADLEII
ncbi:MAG: flagellar basal body P-ring protein FlgI [Desulfobulbaceae bacterium]|nr:flagellar basal body P-ring protein FlgI [Desulfobulbaceae bacterium]